MKNIYIGTSGWYYDHWENVLYPPNTPKSDRFLIYQKQFNAVEINATFYRIPFQNVVKGWYRKSPPDFKFVAKANRQITHKNKLVETDQYIEKFISAISKLEDKLANILFQLPPSLRYDLNLLENFLATLSQSYRYSFEFRNASWERDETYDLLQQYKMTYCIVNRKNYPFNEVITSDTVYYRLHGPEAICASPYSDQWLFELAQKITPLDKTVFVFFNNDIGGHAVRNAERLKEFVEKLMKNGIKVQAHYFLL